MDAYIDAISDDRYGCPGVFSIQRCPSCGQMATCPPLTEDDLPALYSSFYPRRHVDYQELQTEAHRAASPYAAIRRWMAGTDNQGHYLAQPGQTVLDIGSGSCLALLELRAMGIEAWGVEADPNVRDIAEHFDLRVHIGSIHDCPFPDQSFDLIVLNQVIEHVPDPFAMLEAVGSRLNPGGRVWLSFPNVDSWPRRISGWRWINWHVPYHQHHFNRRSFARLASRAGYAVGRVRTITPNMWIMMQLRAFSQQTSQGEASSNWSPDALPEARRGRLARYAMRFSALGLAVAARGADALGKGDSLLVELRVP